MGGAFGPEPPIGFARPQPPNLQNGICCTPVRKCERNVSYASVVKKPIYNLLQNLKSHTEVYCRTWDLSVATRPAASVDIRSETRPATSIDVPSVHSSLAVSNTGSAQRILGWFAPKMVSTSNFEVKCAATNHTDYWLLQVGRCWVEVTPLSSRLQDMWISILYVRRTRQ